MEVSPSSGTQGEQETYGRLANFHVEKCIGQGAFSDVYIAVCVRLRRRVALKKIKIMEIQDAKVRQDCINEIDLLRQCNHKNVIKYLASFLANNELHIVLELADGGDLGRHIANFRSRKMLMSEKMIWGLFVQVCAALEHMHGRRVMHRDIKPDNIFITVDGTVKLGDLGLGRFFSSATAVVASKVGTPYYLSPERIGQDSYDFKSDIWSMGCVLYEMAALYSPFYGEKMSYLVLAKNIEKCSYPPLSASYSRELLDLVGQCIIIDPATRPAASYLHTVSRQMHEKFKKP